MRVGEVVNTWVYDGNLSSLVKSGALLCHEPKKVVPAWMLCRRGRVRTKKTPSNVWSRGKAKHKGCVTWSGCFWRGRGPTNLSSPSPRCGALLLPRSTLKHVKWINGFSWSSSLPHRQAVLLRWRFATMVFPAKIQASPYSFFFFFLLCACKTCQRLRFLSAKEMSQGLSKVSFPFIFVFCCQFSSCISWCWKYTCISFSRTKIQWVFFT